MLSTSAKAFLNAVGATSGPLYATAFIRAAAAIKGRAVLDRDAVVDMVTAMVKGIRDRGKADRGDKTMIDAWLPAAEAAEAARLAGRDLSECLDAALFAAQAGAEATKSMVASKRAGVTAGRACHRPYGPRGSLGGRYTRRNRAHAWPPLLGRHEALARYRTSHPRRERDS